MSNALAMLQPVSTGDLIDRSARFYRAHFGSLLLTGSIPGMIAVAGGILRSYGETTVPIGLLGNVITFFVAPVINLMLVGGVGRAIGDYFLRDHPFSLPAVLMAVARSPARHLRAALVGWFLLPLGVVLAVMALGLGAIFASPILITAQEATGPRLVALGGVAFLTVLGAAAGAFIFLQLYGRVVLLQATVAIEEQPVSRAFRRAFELGRKNWRKVLGVLAFEYCLTWSVFLALGTPVAMVALSRGFQTTSGGLEKAAFASSILLNIAGICAAPISLVAFALLYFDCRVRKEGLDLQVLLELEQAEAPAP
ncbi:MAG: hypothetical protein HY650_15455 [Acidobacteria bacterium]|nr:hypothetical protein [Acidobacteriota bacterium]